MTKDEALLMALEALEHEADKGNDNAYQRERDAIKQVLAAPVREPVAWAMYKRGRLQSFWLDKGDAFDFEFTSEHEWKPLYTTPPAQPAPVAWMYEDMLGLVGVIVQKEKPIVARPVTPLYATPLAAQRQWVGLAEEDKRLFSSWLDDKEDDEVFVAIEAKLKEKNNG